MLFRIFRGTGGFLMGVFSRLSDLLHANLNDLIDRAEDPEKMIRQIIADMQSELNKAVQNYSKIRSGQILAEKKYQDALKTSQEWESKARNALSQGDNIVARQALTRKIAADEEVTAYREMYDSISAQTEVAHTQVEALKLKIEEAKSRQAILAARAKMAETQKKLSEMSENPDSTEKNFLNPDKHSGQCSNDSKVESELARLISEMNITETSGQE